MKKEIDDGIKDIINLLNKMGLITEYSCSGLFSDHHGQPVENFRDGQGYISFHQISKEKELALKKVVLASHLVFFKTGDIEQLMQWDSEIESFRATPSIVEACNIRNFCPLIQLKDGEVTDEIKEDIFRHQWKLLYDQLQMFNKIGAE